MTVIAAAGCAGGVGGTTTGAVEPSGPPASRVRAADQMLADGLSSAPRPAPKFPATFRVHRSAEGGVSLALPPGWQAVAGPDARYPGVIQTLGRVHASFLPYLVELATPDSPLKLFAVDAASDRRHPSVATVQAVTWTAPGPYARWSQRVLRGLAALPSLRGRVAARRVELHAGTALRAAYLRSDGERVVLYVVAGRHGLWAVTFAALPAVADRSAPLFAAAVSSLELTEPAGGPSASGVGPPPAS